MKIIKVILITGLMLSITSIKAQAQDKIYDSKIGAYVYDCSTIQDETATDNADDVELIDLGTYKTTAYCSCSKCCGKYANGKTATGTTATQGRTIAVDKRYIPLGSQVVINGITYTAEDTGVKGKTIDIYFDSHQAALNYGVKKLQIQMIKE